MTCNAHLRHGARTPQAGAALLAAMITVALVATLAAAALWRQWRGVEVEAAERARVQSAWLLTGALDWSRLILSGDAQEDQRAQTNSRQAPADHLGEPWAMPLAEARLSTFLAAGESAPDTGRDAFLSGQVSDLQSRLNLMNLLATTDPDPIASYERFEKLFQLLNLPVGELGALQRALQRADAAMKGKLEGGSGDAPLMPLRFDQLAWLGVSPSTLETLRSYVTVLPLVNHQATVINLNTASAQVIAAAVPEMNLAHAQRVVTQRNSSVLREKNNVLQITGLATAKLDWVDVKSDFFEVRGRLRLDDVALEEVSAVQRDRASRRVTVLWRERTALSLATATGALPPP